ncbi:glycosyl hydrolase family 18 protein [Hyalangium versicolor]|uniref:glycosyl hydrolase family 18 protein n=1 Tax=Hyalangium versicolor TaxID=2861190 RepID=UPI001CCA4667|nr:glycosyl hydrolase family 18 protein [Hyalangium versicolor]
MDSLSLQHPAFVPASLRLGFLLVMFSASVGQAASGANFPSTVARGQTLANSGFTFRTTSVWTGGYCAELQVPNTSGSALNGWTVKFSLASGMTISSVWQGQWTAQGSEQTVKDAGWNGALAVGESALFGFCGAQSGTVSEPLNCTFNGQVCGSTSPTDMQSPSTVTGLTLVSRTTTSLDLSWAAATDNVGVTGYEVFLAGSSTPVATPTGTDVSIGGLVVGTNYTFTVKARDAAGNRSATSASLTASTEANSNFFRVTSTWTGGYCAEMRVPNITGTTINGWTVKFSLVSNMTISSVWQGQWTAQGSLQTVKDIGWNGGLAPGAVALFGFCGSVSGTASEPLNCTLNGLTCGATPPPDTQPPSVVSGVTVTGKGPGSIDLAWTAATDTVGVTGYEIFLSTGTAAVATSTGTSVSVAGLAPETSYTFTVKARDAAGNRSAASAPVTATTAKSKKLVGYFVRWGVYGRAFYPKSLDASGAAAKLTHLNYAFGNVVNGKCTILASPQGDPWADYQMGFDASKSVDGQADTWDQPLKGNFNQLKKLKAKYPKLQVMISLGGWDWSGGFSDAVSTAEKRQAFVASCVDLYIRGNLPGMQPGALAGVFDGIDVDWEFPVIGGLTPGRPEDTANFTAVLAEFRRQLDLVRPGLQLSIATGSSASAYSKIQLAQIHSYLNHVNIMTYDMHGGWDATTNFHAALYNQSGNPAKTLKDSTHEAVQGHLASGVPASKLVVGVPFYGRGWQGTQPGPAGDGLYQTTSGAAHGNWDDGGNTGLFDYYYIRTVLEPAGVKYRHPEAKVPYVYNPATKVWVSYDDPTSLGVKGDYINSNNLGGAMIWELGGDDALGSLVAALKSKLNP